MSVRCHKKFCRTLLVDRLDAIGRVSLVCEPCERNKRGLCRDCPATLPLRPIRGYANALRCPTCNKRRYAERQKERYRKNPEHYRRIARKSWAQPHRLERKRQWRTEWLKKNPTPPRTNLDRLYHRAWRAKWLKNPKNRQHLLEWTREWRNRPEVREKLNAAQRRRRMEQKQQKARAA